MEWIGSGPTSELKAKAGGCTGRLLRGEWNHLFTIFTSTYNRAHLLIRLYNSLREQTVQDFEWVIVDDGSSDGTDKLVEKWAHEAQFPIIYRWQKNSGKHVAINRGVEIAQGYHFVIVDSDDWLAPDALEQMSHHWDSIPAIERKKFVGVAGLFADITGAIVGDPFPDDIWDSNMLERWALWRINGDKLETFRTDILRAYPFPENLGIFVPEGIVWHRIAITYRTRYFNRVVGYKEYQTDGLSGRGITFAVKTAYARWYYFKELCDIGNSALSLVIRLKCYASYTRFALHAGIRPDQQLKGIRSKKLWLLTYPIGTLGYVRDRLNMLMEKKKP